MYGERKAGSREGAHSPCWEAACNSLADLPHVLLQETQLPGDGCSWVLSKIHVSYPAHPGLSEESSPFQKGNLVILEYLLCGFISM